MSKVTNKLDQLTIKSQENDPWADFREIEVIGLEWTQNYKHSLGKYSRFFLELENGRFLATHCSTCEKTWTPPRPACPDCLAITIWQELSGKGSLVSWSVLHYAPKMLAKQLSTPYVLAYVQLEGASTLFAHLLKNFGNLKKLHHHMPVQVVYATEPVDHPIMLMAFEPIGGE